MSLEVIWATKFWPNRVFAFLLGIYNTYYDEDDDKTPDKKWKHHESGHCLVTLPKNKNFLGP